MMAEGMAHLRRVGKNHEDWCYDWLRLRGRLDFHMAMKIMRDNTDDITATLSGKPKLAAAATAAKATAKAEAADKKKKKKKKKKIQQESSGICQGCCSRRKGCCHSAWDSHDVLFRVPDWQMPEVVCRLHVCSREGSQPAHAEASRSCQGEGPGRPCSSIHQEKSEDASSES